MGCFHVRLEGIWFCKLWVKKLPRVWHSILDGFLPSPSGRLSVRGKHARAAWKCGLQKL